MYRNLWVYGMCMMFQEEHTPSSPPKKGLTTFSTKKRHLQRVLEAENQEVEMPVIQGKKSKARLTCDISSVLFVFFLEFIFCVEADVSAC